MLFTIAHRLLRIVKGPCLNIFIFHRVLTEHDPILPDEPTVEQFDAIIHWIKQDFDVFTLGDALRKLKTSPCHRPLAALTFDDGYADNYLNAMPILQRHGVKGTFFIATGYLDGGCMWNDKIIESVRNAKAQLDLRSLGLDSYEITSETQRVNTLNELLKTAKYLPHEKRDQLADAIADATQTIIPTNLMMTTEQLLEMESAGMEIGAHTQNHPILSKTNSKYARLDIKLGKIDLEKKLKFPIELFAYPNGKLHIDYTDEHAKIVLDLGFKGSVSTNHGSTNKNTNIFHLPRFTPWQRNKLQFRFSLLKNIAFSNRLT